MNPSFRLCATLIVSAALLAGAGCLRVKVHGDPHSYREAMSEPELRLATYNVSLYSEQPGGLLRRLQANDAEARKVAAVLQRVRPDVVLLNEFDHDAEGRAADLFQRGYLEAPQPGGGDPLQYRYRYFAPVNTGVPSGLDLDGDGGVGAEGRARGNDAWGYGLHPGQYGMLLLSKYPIDHAAARTFQRLRWAAMPGARRPVDPVSGTPWHPDAVWAQLRLSSKSHWDVPVRTPAGRLHVLASHPTPPVFDGPEDRNGARNADEIRLWSEYLSHGERPWLCDDAGRCGGLEQAARFVILGDLNNDPADGDGRHEAILELLRHPRVLPHAAPSSEGAVAAARNAPAVAGMRRGDPASATGDFGPVGPLRLDYVLPSTGWAVVRSGVFWPAPGAPAAAIVDGTDHRLVWVDVRPLAVGTD
ncbi:endonuclease/exonuclease/phosphatase family protein [Luteimonas sp. RD2P54]|uniref:Endonuclease/exonuclease/phosphatase family protein n=1 Tax=Luteimonas endophytica TaxID=3042023 RepID=A0ABT6JBC4_9GAMM|nr:endonuclease/exonuclease/phosphatase family protein [Luteimonas endophytica]MDH5824106.1 endonuclease/exonuclease/phosphatase family protein [Luteimonas endophytica]